jgi:nickel/cobalt transporter (NicO) family protein
MLANARARGKRAPECAPMQLEILAVASAGLLAGVHHALTGPDHMAGVAPLVAARAERHWRIGFSWGLGHAGGALVAAGVALALRAQIPGLEEHLSAVSERVVGVVLCVIGAFGLRAALRRDPPRHVHGRSAFGLGLIHGAAGLSHLFAVLPSLALPGLLLPVLYLGGYAAGCLAALTGFAATLGRLPRAQARLWLGLSGGASVAVGVCWIVHPF